MLLHFILALTAVAFLLIHDLIQDKTSFLFKNHYIKYASALILGTAGLPYFLEWKIAQDAEMIALIIAFGLFFNTIAGFFASKGIKGIPTDGSKPMGAFLDPNTHPNANGSHIFAIIIIAAGILTHVLAFFFDKSLYSSTGFIVAAVAGNVIAITASAVNMANTFETNDTWKTAFGVASCIVSIVVSALPIALSNGG